MGMKIVTVIVCSAGVVKLAVAAATGDGGIETYGW